MGHRLVPSAVHLLEQRGLLDRIGSWPPVARHVFLGRQAEIGRPTVERNQGIAHAAFVPGFKLALMTESVRPLARCGRRAITARDAAAAFLRELLAEVKRVTGRRPRDLVVTAPVMAFETYRAEVQAILRDQSRLPGASPGQVSIAEGEAGQLSLADDDPRGRVSLPEGR